MNNDLNTDEIKRLLEAMYEMSQTEDWREDRAQ